MPETIEYKHLSQLPDVELSLGKFRHFSFAPHVHLDFHIGAVTQGAQRYLHKGRQLVLTPGSLATMNPDMMHTGQSANDSGYVTRVLSVPVSLVADIARARGRNEWFFKAGLQLDNQLYHQFISLHQALYQQLPALAAEPALMEFVEALLLKHGESATEANAYKLSSQSLAQIHSLFHAEPGEEYSLQTLADLAGLSRYQLLRQFKQATGMPPFAYLQRIRLEYAKKGLHTRQRLCDLACSLGFFDEAHLNKAFKQAYTLSPSAYRQALVR